MKIKSAISFRKWYKNLTSARKHVSQFWDENFIGAQHNDLSGFFTMYHGDKVQVYDFLRKEVEMVETDKLYMNLFKMPLTAILQNSICFMTKTN